MRTVRKIILTIALVLVLSAFTLNSYAARPVKLFGVPLSTATRAKLEPALIKAGFIPLQKYLHEHPFSADSLTFSFASLNPVGLKGHLRYDAYKTTGQLKGVYDLAVGYTLFGRFAIAKYFIHGLYDLDVLAMLKDKYGRPYSVVRLGTLTGRSEYTWKEKNGIEIVLSEGFSYTDLKYINVLEYNIRIRQVKEAIRKSDKAPAKKESGAF